jgi:predicted dehydrogenase
MGQNILGCLHNLDRVALAAVCDPDESALRRVMAETGAPGHADYRRMIEVEKPNLVYIASPNHAHEEQARFVLGRGLPLVLQKPMAHTLAGCHAVMEAWRARRTFFHVGFELRLTRMFRRVKALIDEGRIGEVRDVSANYYTGLWPTWAQREGGWKYRREGSGGMFAEKLCHSIDLFRHFSGSEFSEVTAYAPDRPIVPWFEITDNCHAIFRLRNGGTARITFSFTRAAAIPFDPGPANYDPDEREGHAYDFTVIGTRGSLFLNVEKKFLTLVRHDAPGSAFHPHVDLLEDFSVYRSNKELYHDNEGELRTVADLIRSGGNSPVDPEDAFRSMEAVFKAQESLDARRTVAFEPHSPAQ